MWARNILQPFVHSNRYESVSHSFEYIQQQYLFKVEAQIDPKISALVVKFKVGVKVAFDMVPLASPFHMRNPIRFLGFTNRLALSHH